MSVASPAISLARSRIASPRWVTAGVFFAFALGIGLWAGSIPVLMRQSGLTATGLGLAITLHSGAYILAMMGAGWLTRWVELRRLIRVLLLLHAGAFFLLFSATSPLWLTLALIALGLTAGATDLAMNTEATALEREAARPVLTRMHAAASGAFAIGAISGSLLASAAGPMACAVLAAAAILPVVWAVQRLGPRPPVALQKAAPGARGSAGSVVWLIGVVLGLSIAAEVTAQMWSAQFLAQQAAQLAALVGAGAALFAGCQSVVRLFGDRLRKRFDDLGIIRASLALAALGFAVVALSDRFGWSVLGFALVGLGTACVVPCCFALIARSAPHRAAAALGQASLVAGLLRLPAPLCLGYVAAAWSDAAAFAGVALALVLGVLMLAVHARTGARIGTRS
ncbi:major facilitator superfamily MFS_1 [Leptothrix cholodnii SP-6]|uniref:Major facilitator superfamily MFS_1 n=1 Tax=Leptothrix cholodnii (strain ATCC 51168 / LMG 8142 / SP-6) TaxID=395495 RepID=B1Y0B3_LEPCP|nr:MFS transporter [Leptothrix cholodnii]ACB36592.1 major facilitator superfamily MFS_1 [Leptothrix cholodnii SP-6]